MPIISHFPFAKNANSEKYYVTANPLFPLSRFSFSLPLPLLPLPFPSFFSGKTEKTADYFLSPFGSSPPSLLPYLFPVKEWREGGGIPDFKGF